MPRGIEHEKARSSSSHADDRRHRFGALESATTPSPEEGVGKILKALKETNQLDNTVIVFTSDNGYFYVRDQSGDQ